MNFDEVAKSWDTDKRNNRAKIIADKIRSSIATGENCSAMEFGCGTGLISFHLCDRFKSITLIDSSKGMIDMVISKIDQYQLNNMVAKCIDIAEENSFNVKFDVIYNSMVLHHINNTAAILKNFYELLNVDGYLCIVDLDEEDGSFHKNYPDFDGHNGFNQNELKSILIKEGFQDIESNTFYFDEKMIEGSKIKYSLFIMMARKY